MRTNRLWLPAAAILVSACGHGPTDKGVSTFHSNSCKAVDNAADCTILVDVFANAQGTNCEVKVLDSQYTVAFRRGARDKRITWEISGSSLEDAQFVSKGIDPKPPQADIDAWNNNFKNGGADHGGLQFKWKNDNDPVQAGRSYRYNVTVQVRRPGGTTWTCTQDPVIRN